MVLALQLQDMDKAIEMLDQSTGLGERAFNLEHTAQFADVVLFLESDIHQVTGLRSACNCWQKEVSGQICLTLARSTYHYILDLALTHFRSFQWLWHVCKTSLWTCRKNLFVYQPSSCDILMEPCLGSMHRSCIAKPRYVPFKWKCKTFSAGKG